VRTTSRGPHLSITTLVGPDGVVPLNESAAAILALCDGTRTVRQIVERLMPSPAPGAHYPDDICNFLRIARELGWVLGC
jgi:pyrroloquinoline quinone biosynthesis protein D